MEHIGMDLGKRESQIAILTEDGELIEKRIRTERIRLSEVFGSRPRARIFWRPPRPNENQHAKLAYFLKYLQNLKCRHAACQHLKSTGPQALAGSNPAPSARTIKQPFFVRHTSSVYDSGHRLCGTHGNGGC